MLEKVDPQNVSKSSPSKSCLKSRPPKMFQQVVLPKPVWNNRPNQNASKVLLPKSVWISRPQ